MLPIIIFIEILWMIYPWIQRCLYGGCFCSVIWISIHIGSIGFSVRSCDGI